MQNFTYVNPTKIHFGKDVTENLGHEVRCIANTILLVYGKNSIKQNGVYEQVIDSLTSHHIKIFEHAGVSGNPTLSHTREGIELAKEAKIQLIVAVGGGSVIDEAKAIAMGAVAECDVWDFYTKKEKPSKALPIISVLTLPATGSEMNGFTVLTNNETKEKKAMGASPLLNPVHSFLDPQATFSLSPQQTAYACADIISHLTEGYFTTSSSELPFQDNFISGLFHAIVDSMRKVKENTEDYDARAAFMLSATVAWNGIAQVGIPELSLPCHGLEMPLSGIYNIAHGAGLSIITPHWMRVTGKLHAERLKKFGREVLKLKVSTIESTAKAMEDLYKEIGAPLTLKEVGISTPDIDRLTKDAFEAFKSRNVQGYSKEDIRKIFESII